MTTYLVLTKREENYRIIRLHATEHSIKIFLNSMAIRVVEFSNGGYKIRKVFA